MFVTLDQRNRNHRRKTSGNAIPQAAMTLTVDSGILLSWRTGEEGGGRERTGFRDNFPTLWASNLMA